MKKLTYQEAYNKIIDAYFRDEIKPADAQFCFCGTLCDNSSKWFSSPLMRHFDSHGYSGEDFVKMEVALFNKICDEEGVLLNKKGTKLYEENLFSGMCAALEVLKQIHKERGEDVDGVTEFTKRKLQPQP